jgi:hypothetical protein
MEDKESKTFEVQENLEGYQGRYFEQGFSKFQG